LSPAVIFVNGLRCGKQSQVFPRNIIFSGRNFTGMRLIFNILIFCLFISACSNAENLSDSLRVVLRQCGGDYSGYSIFDCKKMRTQSKAFAILSKPEALRGERIAQFSLDSGKWSLDWIDSDRGQNPWKITTGDPDGDGNEDVAFCVWKKSNYWRGIDNRFFVYKIVGDRIAPMWLGSRLALPFLDAEFVPAPGGRSSLLMSLEKCGKLTRVVIYEWKSFGFFRVDTIWEGDGINTLSEYKSVNQSKQQSDK
jgi:hypothetical protein